MMRRCWWYAKVEMLVAFLLFVYGVLTLWLLPDESWSWLRVSVLMLSLLMAAVLVVAWWIAADSCAWVCSTFSSEEKPTAPTSYPRVRRTPTSAPRYGEPCGPG